MTIIHDALLEIAQQMRIANALELARFAEEAGWPRSYTDDMARRLGLDLDSLNPPTQKENE